MSYRDYKTPWTLKKEWQWSLGVFIRIYHRQLVYTTVTGKVDKRSEPRDYYSVTVNSTDPETGHEDTDFRYSAGIAFLEMTGYYKERDLVQQEALFKPEVQ